MKDRMDRHFDASKTRRLELLLDACAKRHQQTEDELLGTKLLLDQEQAKNESLRWRIELMKVDRVLTFLLLFVQIGVMILLWWRRGS